MKGMSEQLSLKARPTEQLRSGPSALVLDSDRTFRETLVNRLLIAGFERVEAASTEDEAVLLLLRHTFDVVLVEVRPMASALQLAGHVRSAQATAQVVFMLDDRQGKRLPRFPVVLKSSLPRSLFEFMGVRRP